MLSERQARDVIRALWTDWDGRTGAASDKAAYYDWLVANKPQVLHFKISGDKKQRIMAWLSGY